MNELTYDEIDLSQDDYRSEFKTVITEDMMNEFGRISGDNNPLHIDCNYAREKGYEKQVVYGMLISSFYSRLVGMYLPGRYCLLHRIDTRFHRPVYIGDELTISGYIKKKVEVGKTLIIEAWIDNQDGERVNSAKIEVGCLA